MYSFLDAKSMAKTLRQLLAERGWSISHSESLELVAKQFGVPNWNVLAARIEKVQPSGPELELPEGWLVTGQTDKKLFRLGVDPATPGVALIESRFSRNSGIEMDGQFAAFMQSISAEQYRGKRIQLAAELRTEDVDRGSIWLRVDTGPGRVSSFDNMLERRGSDGALTGTAGWTRRSIVLPVAEDAASIHFGFLLSGFGRLWARGMELNTVSDAVPLTSGWGKWLAEPSNLGFAIQAQSPENLPPSRPS